MTLFGIWSLELICHLVLGIWCFLKVQIHILADEKIGIFDDGGRTNPLPTDKGIVSPLILNGRGRRGSIVMTREDHRLSG